MARMLEISDQEFETTMINILRALMSKVESKQVWMGNVSRQMEILRENQKEILERKTTTEMKMG